MNERYREAADAYEERAEYCKRMAGIEGGVPPLTGSRHSWEEDAKRHELAAEVLSKLATGEWVLCQGESVGFTIISDTSGGMIANIADWETPEYTPLYIAIPELP